MLLFVGKAQDDLVLEIVIFLGTAAYDEDCASLLCKADILLSLIELLKGKRQSGRILKNTYAKRISFYNCTILLQPNKKTTKWFCKLFTFSIKSRSTTRREII